jgi:hypothetical protein
MEPTIPDPTWAAYWAQRTELATDPYVIGGPNEGSNVIPCPALVSHDGETSRMIHVAWSLNELELAALAQGATLWLTCWGGLPIHNLEVIP